MLLSGTSEAKLASFCVILTLLTSCCKSDAFRSKRNVVLARRGRSLGGTAADTDIISVMGKHIGAVASTDEISQWRGSQASPKTEEYTADRVVVNLNGGEVIEEKNCRIREDGIGQYWWGSYLSVGPPLDIKDACGDMVGPTKINKYIGAGGFNQYKKVFTPRASPESARRGPTTAWNVYVDHQDRQRLVDSIEIYFGCIGTDKGPNKTAWSIKTMPREEAIAFRKLWSWTSLQELAKGDDGLKAQINASYQADDDSLFKLLVRISYAYLIPTSWRHYYSRNQEARKILIAAVLQMEHSRTFSELPDDLILGIVQYLGIGNPTECRHPVPARELLNQVFGEGSFRKFIENLVSRYRDEDSDEQLVKVSRGEQRIGLLNAAQSLRDDEQRALACRAVVKVVTKACEDGNTIPAGGTPNETAVFADPQGLLTSPEWDALIAVLQRSRDRLMKSWYPATNS